MGEVTAFTAHLPNAVVGAPPHCLKMIEQRLLEFPGGSEMLNPTCPRMVQCVHHLAVDIELELIRSRIADAHRLRVLVAVEPRHLAFGQPSRAGAPVHDLDLIRTASGSTKKPIPPSPCLVIISGI